MIHVPVEKECVCLKKFAYFARVESGFVQAQLKIRTKLKFYIRIRLWKNS